MLELEQISFPHLQWIYYREALDCKDSSGQHVQMEHAFHRGEFEFKGLKPDGYLFKDGKHHFFEFLGNNCSLSIICSFVLRMFLARMSLYSKKQMASKRRRTSSLHSQQARCLSSSWSASYHARVSMERTIEINGETNHSNGTNSS